MSRGVRDRLGDVPLPARSETEAAAADDVTDRALSDGHLTPDEAVRCALLNDWRLRAMFERLEIARARVLSAVLPPNPVASGEWSALMDGRTGHLFELTVTESVVDLLLIPLRKDVADARFERTIDEVTGAVVDLAIETRMAYRDLQTQRLLVTTLEESAEAATLAADAARRLHDAGNVPEVEFATRYARAAEARVDHAAAHRRALEVRERLALLMGLPPDAPLEWSLDAADGVPDGPAAIADTVEHVAVERSLDLAAARHELETLYERVGVARIEQAVPELSAGVNAERIPHGPWDSEGPIVTASIPLFRFGQAAGAEATARLRQAWFEFTHRALLVRRRARAAYIGAASHGESVRYQSEVVLPRRREATAATQRRFNAMQIGVFELLEAKELELEAERRRAETLHAYWRSRLTLEALLLGRIPRDGFGFSTYEPRGPAGAAPDRE